MQDPNSYPDVKVGWTTHDDQSEHRNHMPRDPHQWDSGGGGQGNI